MRMSGGPEVGEHRAVGELRSRPWTSDCGCTTHVDPLVGRAEQVVGLHHLQALVHQRGRVDRDLAAHRPRGVRERLLDGHVRRAAARVRPRNGPPLAVIVSRSHRARGLSRDQLVQRRVLGVDRHDPRAGRLGERD